MLKQDKHAEGKDLSKTKASKPKSLNLSKQAVEDKSLSFFQRLGHKIRSLKLDATRRIVSELYPEIPEQVVWNQDEKVHPSFADESAKEQLAQRSLYGFMGILIADRMAAKARRMIIPFALLSGLIGAGVGWGLTSINEFTTQSLFWLFGVMALAVLVEASGFTKLRFMKFLMPKNFFYQEDVESAQALIKRTMIRDFDADTTPADLQDRYRILRTDADGKPVDGQVMITDIEVPVFYYSVRSILWGLGLTVVASFGVAAMGFMATSYYSVWFDDLIAGSIIAVASPILFSVLTIAFLKNGPLASRIAAAHLAQNNSATLTLVDKVGVDYFRNIEEARATQIELAAADDSKFIKLGESTGQLADRRDPFAPGEGGMPFGLSMNDLSTHLLILGQTGSGKTSGAIRPIAHQVMAADNSEFGTKNGIGALVLDGKGPLPFELADLSDNYKVINPDFVDFNPIENLSADEVADGFFEMFAGGASGDDYWNKASAKLIRASAVTLSLTNLPWNLTTLYRVMIDDDYVENTVCDLLPAEDTLLPHQRNGVNYRISDFVRLPEKTKGSILGTAQIWLSAIIDHEKLAAWGDVENGVTVEDVCKGAKFGFALPESQFGQAGQLISIFAKKRAYKAIKNRGDKWKNDEEQTAVLLLADEVQNLLTADESAMLPIARSLGLYCVFSTQNIDGIVNALGSKDEANQLLGNLLSMVALKSETNLTKAFVSARMGSEWRAVMDKAEGVPDAQFDYNAMAQSSVDTMIQATNLRYNASVSTGFGRTLASKALSVAVKAADPIREIFTGEDSPIRNSEIKNVAIVSENEIASLLARPNTALAQINRARVQRRDVIKLNPIY